MASLRRRDNVRELALRRALHARGLRYRVTFPVPGLPRRTIDIAFTRIELAVFLDGCFWHGCPEHGNRPRANAEWWSDKIAANTARDADTNAHLGGLGWRVLRLWEHIPLSDAVDEVERAVRSRRTERLSGRAPGR